MDVRTEIELFIKDYLKTYFIDRSFEKVNSFFSHNITCIGTGLHEFGLTPEKTLDLYRNDINELPTPINFSDVKITVCSVTPNVSTVICTFNIQTEVDESILLIPNLRNSFTLVKERSEWKILQLHISTPNDQQEEVELYPLQKMIKKNELLKQLVEEKTKELQFTNDELIKSNITKDKLFSIISHDLKSPFNSLLGFVNILEEEYDELDTVSHKKFIKTIYNSSNLIYNLLDNLLTWSRIQTHKIEFSPTVVDLLKISENSIEVLRGLSNDKNITITNEIKNPLFVLSDEFMLSTIFRNLISNSIKFTPNSGSITLSVKEVKTPSKSLITVCIQDTGIGIESSDLEGIFKTDDVKSTRGTNNEDGTGIGLSICKEFIDYHNSKIWVESEVGVGSKFCFNLNLF